MRTVVLITPLCCLFASRMVWGSGVVDDLSEKRGTNGVVLCAQNVEQPRQATSELRLPSRRWSAEEAWDWYRNRPWLVGTNYLPSTACNTTEFWQAESFDEPTIRKELALAQATGFNTVRVFLQYLVWKHDPAGFKQRFSTFLQIAHQHGVSVMPTLFDDCSFGDPPIRQPFLGPQREPIPGMIAPSWTPSPGLDTVTDREAWPDLEKYVRDLVGSFADDPRVVAWDLYNEPGNSGMGNRSLPLVEAVFDWARAVDPRQPMTVAVWSDGLGDLNDAILARSDIITYHAYTNYQGQRAAIVRHKRHQRPVLCTEWMARWLGSCWETDLPLFRREAVGCYNWGLVNGRMQCQFGWGSKRGEPESKIWFHDLYHRDGRPYDPQEIAAIRKVTADKHIDFTAADYTRPQPDPGAINERLDAADPP
ncbi:MAG: cellulase family glycosylhydrolase [Pirellulaceae bacterium]